MTLSLRLTDVRPTLTIVETDDREWLAHRLQRDRYNAAYALAQLDDDAWPEAAYYVCQTPQGESVVCHSRAGLGQATTLAGPVDGVSATLLLHPGFPTTFAIGDPDHASALESVYTFRQVKRMMRMMVDRDTFRPNRRAAQPMVAAHVDLLNRLYNAEGEPAHYRGSHIGEGCYWGVVDEDRLVAVAGTHAIGITHGIAILGNVFTHPRYRGRGHGTTVTSAVTAALLEQVGEVVLSVDPDNAPAVRAYRNLGYRHVGHIIEASATRHAGTLVTAARRWAARRRGGDGLREVVRA